MKKINVALMGVCLTAGGIASLLTGNVALAGVCFGALAGWLGGNKNGEEDKF